MPYDLREQNPEASPPPPRDDVMPWEDGSRGFLGRFFATVGSTFAPVRTAKAAAQGRVMPAFTFALLTLFPCMLLWGVFPLTRTITFEPALVTKIAKGTSAAALQQDILRAAGLGLLLSAFGFLSWAVPFVSLAGAFSAESIGATQGKVAAWRTALYRAWVVPCGMLLMYLSWWIAPSMPSEGAQLLTLVMLQVFPRMLIVVHCNALAREVGASPFGALGVSIVPLLVEWAAGSLMWNYAQSLLPHVPSAT